MICRMVRRPYLSWHVMSMRASAPMPCRHPFGESNARRENDVNQFPIRRGQTAQFPGWVVWAYQGEHVRGLYVADIEQFVVLIRGDNLDGITMAVHKGSRSMLIARIRRSGDAHSRQPYPLSWEEQKAFFLELPPHLRPIALYKVNTGCREQEVCKLRWEWEIAVPELKTSVFLLPADFGGRFEDS